MINVMLIAWVKFQSARETSYQPAFMSDCLIISHTCFPCLPSGRTLLFWNDLFFCWEGGDLGKVGEK